VDGSCGSANGQAFSTTPATSLLCATGTPSALYGTGPWTWSCAGTNGGNPAPCAAPKGNSNSNSGAGPGTGPACSEPSNPQNLDYGIEASSNIPVYIYDPVGGNYQVEMKTYFDQYVGRPNEHAYFFQGFTAGCIDKGIYLGDPDVPNVFSVNGLPATDGVIPVTWITAGNISGPVDWQGYAHPDVGMTFIAVVVVDYNAQRGDTFELTPDLAAGYTIHSETWGSWIDFSSIGAGWIAFLNYNMTADQIGSVDY
jgi:hypothetical protein